MKKFYITTSIFYTNANPHIGHALESIQADVIARYHRILGENVFFLTGTDEHGQKNTKAAEAMGKSPEAFTDEISQRVKELKKALNLSNDDFIRTTDQKRHWPAVKKAWLRLNKKGDIYKKKYKGFYCVGCEAFITKKDLKDGKCVVHQKKPEIIEEENYFFRLSKYSKEIENIIKEDKIKIIPNFRKNEILNFIKKGLEDISFSRQRKNLKWAIPVPDDSEASIYVWADALSNYISALGYAENGDKFKRFWPADVHCIGKDILRFHGLIWSAMLLSLKLPLPKTIFVHGFITVNEQKMSKSLGNIINPFELNEKYGTDAVRYFLLREIPPTEDGDFSYQKFEQRYNADLANGLGNLVARVVTLAAKLKMKNEKLKTTTKNLKINKIIDKTWKSYKKSLDEFKFNEALIAVWELISFCDRYIEKERPWEDKKNSKTVISDLLFAVSEIAKLIEPFLPETSEKILRQIKTKKSKALFPHLK
ncbi:MAG: methionine--tRNA ligase [Candidatus Pacebacteria bacterium]|nr:methionine--tRNA ligase [Candidatus Paceibacterota bacterium]